MDWNKTKTIFIIVFSIVNIFLYSLYVNKLIEAESVQVMWKTPIEEILKMDNITYDELPPYKNDPFYVSAKPLLFTDEQVEKLENQVGIIVDETLLQSTMKEPVSILNAKGDFDFTEFISDYVLDGAEYMLWELDKDEGRALFFQKVVDDPIYYSRNAALTIYWNKNGKVTNYEQSMLGEFDSFNRKNDLLSPIEAIGNLYSLGHLKKDYKVKHMTLGYSSLVQVTETQVFAPTWHIRVELKDGEREDYFINAIDGMVIEFQPEPSEEEKE
ncbi:two-component system regulatory protein YycI [Sporosarcina sp. JAI121]|uniref:two-component system regulatory protein YycI n=1 Tax=Sporosarcina sp. JAI121 TaxID=2723064 RepID=UPI0015CD596E|nr:two-component system regulatory protein YycI [Sporosarcina sp. JAI121]NYF25565.1 regulatory protein YycI of two-component signal transduction system YycFG [Sporosarcina sp. JAI121]